MAGTSWKVIQVKMKFTLLTFVRSEEDDPLGLMSLNISLFVQLLWGFPKHFFLLGRTLTSKWGFKPNTKAQALAPPQVAFLNANIIISLPVTNFFVYIFSCSYFIIIIILNAIVYFD